MPYLLRVVLFLFSAGALCAQSLPGLWPSRILAGAAAGDKFGVAAAAVPDVTGDGRPEFVVGAFRADRTLGPPLSPAARPLVHRPVLVDAGAAYLYDGARLTLLWRVSGEGRDARLGYAVAGVPDVDGDGAGEVLVGSPTFSGVASWAGRAYLFSGRTGKLLLRLDGDAATAQLGYAVAGLGDLDGDGRGDLLLGAPGRNGRAGVDAGRVYLYSGATGKKLWEAEGEGKNHLFGISVAAVPDVDGDGRDDFLVGAHGYRRPGEQWRGRAYLFSGGNRKLIRVHTGEKAGDTFGWAVAGVPDVNGDGKGDYLVGARDADPGGKVSAGRVYLFSGATGTTLQVFDGRRAYDYLGRLVAGVPDADGDGRGDVLLAAYGADGRFGRDAGVVELRSGATGALLRRFEGEQSGAYLGWGLAGCGDLNGDGRGDLLLGAYPFDEPGKPDAGRLYVHTGGLVAGTLTVSAAAGGALPLSLHGGKGNAGRPYLVAASLTGIRPGLTLPRVHVPLVPDGLTFLSIALANTALFQGTRGVLDANGRAAATVRVPAGALRGAVGRFLIFVWVLADRLDVASNPVAVAVAP